MRWLVFESQSMAVHTQSATPDGRRPPSLLAATRWRSSTWSVGPARRAWTRQKHTDASTVAAVLGSLIASHDRVSNSRTHQAVAPTRRRTIGAFAPSTTGAPSSGHITVVLSAIDRIEAVSQPSHTAGRDQLGERPARHTKTRPEPHHGQSESSVGLLVEAGEVVSKRSTDPQQASGFDDRQQQGYSSSDPNTISTMLMLLLTAVSSALARVPVIRSVRRRQTGRHSRVLPRPRGHWRSLDGTNGGDGIHTPTRDHPCISAARRWLPQPVRELGDRHLWGPSTSSTSPTSARTWTKQR